MLEITKKGIQDIMHLVSAVEALGIKVELLEQRDAPDGYKCIQIHTTERSFNCIVDDEYNDITGENIYAALQAILLTCMEAQDNDNLTQKVLAREPERLAELEDFWQLYQAKIPSPRTIVSPMEWQLNSGAAYVLRSFKE